jgi:hypothetical protein
VQTEKVLQVELVADNVNDGIEGIYLSSVSSYYSEFFTGHGHSEHQVGVF